MDQVSPLNQNTLCSVCYLEPPMGSSPLSVPFLFLYVPQDSRVFDASHGASIDCGLSEALSVSCWIAVMAMDTPVKILSLLQRHVVNSQL